MERIETLKYITKILTNDSSIILISSVRPGLGCTYHKKLWNITNMELGSIIDGIQTQNVTMQYLGK